MPKDVLPMELWIDTRRHRRHGERQAKKFRHLRRHARRIAHRLGVRNP